MSNQDHKVKINFLIFLIVIPSIFACTTVPNKEFASYKESFTKARAASEQVLFDYGAAVEQHQRNVTEKLAKRQHNNVNRIEPPEDPSPSKVTSGAGDIGEHIAVRIKAWDVVERYNDLLTGLAEGKSVAQVTATVDGLYQSLSTFPIAEIADAAGSVSPYIGILKQVAAMAERERSRRRFVETVKAGAPIIGAPIEKNEKPNKNEKSDKADSFLKLLQEDYKNFWTTRRGLYERSLKDIKSKITALSIQYINLAKHYKPNPKLKELTEEINEFRKILGMKEGIKLHKTNAEEKKATKNFSPIIHSQLIQIKDQIKEQIDSAKQKTVELTAYRDVIIAYSEMIYQVSKTLFELVLAVQINTKTIPRTEGLVSIYIELRKAIQTYGDSRGR
jgi:hypothetical protein